MQDIGTKCLILTNLKRSSEFWLMIWESSVHSSLVLRHTWYGRRAWWRIFAQLMGAEAKKEEGTEDRNVHFCVIPPLIHILQQAPNSCKFTCEFNPLITRVLLWSGHPSVSKLMWNLWNVLDLTVAQCHQNIS